MYPTSLFRNSFNYISSAAAKLPLRRTLTDDENWLITGKENHKTLNLVNQGDFETIFTVGNGYAGCRACYEEGSVPNFDRATITGNYIAGIFDQYDSPTEELVNAPNWMGVKVFIDGHHLTLNSLLDPNPKLNPIDVVSHERILDMKQGTVYRHTVYKDEKKRVTHFESLRFLSFDNVHTFAQRIAITPENYSGADIQVQTELDGSTRNQGARGWEPGVDPKADLRYIAEKHGRHNHYEVQKMRFLDFGTGILKPTYMECETLGYKRNINARKIFGYSATDICAKNIADAKTYEFLIPRKSIRMIHVPKDSVKPNESLIFDRFATVYTSRDYFGLGIEALENKEQDNLHKNKQLADKVSQFIEKESSNTLKSAISSGFDKLLENHAKVMQEKKWKHADVKFHGNDRYTQAMRFNLYHLIIAANDKDQQTSIGARALSGEAYNGHCFWDTEIFTLPYFIYAQPEAARSLLLYRYKTLGQARINAKKDNCVGAKYPWESGETGTEQTPTWVGDPRYPERIWTGDEELHITSDVVYGILNYYEAQKDEEFLAKYGIEMMIEVSRYWCSKMEYNKEHDRYDIKKVIGPDESHEHVNNSIFTNWLAKWCIDKTIHYWNIMRESGSDATKEAIAALETKINFKPDEEFAVWQDRAEKIYLPYDEATKVLEEFEGYFKLPDLPIQKWDEHGLPELPEGIHENWPMVEKHPGSKHISATRLIKQADVVMLTYLLGSEPFFTPEVKKANFEFYEPRCVHKSSLSPATHSFMGIETGNHKHVLPYFRQALMVDLENSRGNSAVGIHVASIGGAWQNVVHGFGGFKVVNSRMTFNPYIPNRSEGKKEDTFDGVNFKLIWRGNLLNVDIQRRNATLFLQPLIEKCPEESISFSGKEYVLKPNKKLEIKF